MDWKTRQHAGATHEHTSGRPDTGNRGASRQIDRQEGARLAEASVTHPRHARRGQGPVAHATWSFAEGRGQGDSVRDNDLRRRPAAHVATTVTTTSRSSAGKTPITASISSCRTTLSTTASAHC